MAKLGFLFPGQGSQKVGMGKDLFTHSKDSRALFERANALLGKPIDHICFEGPKDELTKTENAQPGIFLVSLALLELLKQKGITPDYTAGHSLGELTAYYAAGAFGSDSASLETALTVISARGEAMAASHPPEDSAMAAVIGLSKEIIEQSLTAFQDYPVVIANCNTPEQTVISGTRTGVEQAGVILKEKGAKIIPLKVSGPFHSPLMKNGAELFSKKLNELQSGQGSLLIKNAEIPIILNRTAVEEQNSDALFKNLSLQIISQVKWVDTIRYLKDKVDLFIECGPGKVLTGLVKKIDPDAAVVSVSCWEDIESI
ncbi:ACP S-malonyltransferase [Thermoproteota archaeon]